MILQTPCLSNHNSCQERCCKSGSDTCGWSCRLAAGLATVTAIVGGAVYSQTSGHKFNLAKIAEGFGSSLAALFSPSNTNAAIYSLISAAMGVYSLVLLFGTHEVTSSSCFAAPVLLP